MDTDPNFLILEVEAEPAEAEAGSGADTAFAAFSASVSIPFSFLLRWKFLHTSSIRSPVSVRAIGVGSDILALFLENFGVWEHLFSKFSLSSGLLSSHTKIIYYY